MRKIVPCLAILILLGISSSMALSYLSEKKDTVWQIAATDTRIGIEEEEILPEKNITGSEIRKGMRVRNLSQSPCYVRVACFYSDKEAEEICERISIREGWTQRADGYYYWRDELLPGETTEALFDSIVIRSGITQEDIKRPELLFYAEAAGSSGTEELSWEKIK